MDFLCTVKIQIQKEYKVHMLRGVLTWVQCSHIPYKARLFNMTSGRNALERITALATIVCPASMVRQEFDLCTLEDSCLKTTS